MYEKIKKIIDEWYPIELLIINCPEDEYDYEIKKIVSSYYKNISESILGEKVYNIFIEEFDNEIFNKTKEECNIIAKKIIKELAENKN